MSLFDRATLYFLVALAVFISRQGPAHVTPDGSLEEFIGCAYLIASILMFMLACIKAIEKICSAYERRRRKEGK